MESSIALQEHSSLGEGEGAVQLIPYAHAANLGLQHHTDGSEHCQSAMLNLLGLLLKVLLLSIIESKRVESSLSKPKISSLEVTLDDTLITRELNAEDDEHDLPDSTLRDGLDSSPGVRLGESISRHSDIRVSREVKPAVDGREGARIRRKEGGQCS